ncbi:MAG: phosphatase PAP2 family protein [Synergistetes bacterium]|nr:phosphatase PAP2 family protein [Synergistota bacterium]
MDFVFPSDLGRVSCLSKFGNIIGDADFILPLLLSFLCLFYILRLEKWENPILELLCLIVLTALLGNLLKVLLGRARPYMGLGELSFFNFPESLFKNDFQSFPSGHVLVATSTFSWIGMRFKGWIRLAFLFLIVIVAYNRLETNNHFFSDVAFSFALGYALTLGYLREVKGSEESWLPFDPLAFASFFKRLFS